ncbi:hypothetical protein NDU88_002487 [Pleurodeles waltl]|uniref:Uncharacterized protein n=1 Tax=Pleurodeles waltl TaxID=8319 RepID=A0AAV7QA03_PLEWA|nr:hypothetical protein NDU88_002487 [Pleurodeles waltl]
MLSDDHRQTANLRPLDIILKLGSSQMKDKIMLAARKLEKLPLLDYSIELSQTPSQAVLDKSHAVASAMVAVRKRQICYQWMFPFALGFQLDLNTYTIHTPEDA